MNSRPNSSSALAHQPVCLPDPSTQPHNFINPQAPPKMTSPSNEEQITEHRAWLAGISEEGLALFSDLGNLLSEVDELLLKSDEVLNYSQPPMDGKLGIRFWKRHRPDKLEPVVVVWQKSSRTGRFWPKQVNGHLTSVFAGVGRSRSTPKLRWKPWPSSTSYWQCGRVWPCCCTAHGNRCTA